MASERNCWQIGRVNEIAYSVPFGLPGLVGFVAGNGNGFRAGVSVRVSGAKFGCW